MRRDNDERFRPRPKPPRTRGGGRSPRLIARVLREVARDGKGLSIGSSNRRRPTLARLGRGHVAASFSGASLGARSRRVVVKARLVRLKALSPGALATHMRYLARDGIARRGEPGHAYDAQRDQSICNPSRPREAMIATSSASSSRPKTACSSRTCGALRARSWRGSNGIWERAWSGSQSTTGIPTIRTPTSSLRGKDERGQDLIIARSYITHGMRHRACELATEWLGERTESEIRAAIGRDVEREGWTGLDRDLIARSQRRGHRSARQAG